MILKQIISNIANEKKGNIKYIGNENIEIVNISNNSKNIKNKDMFVCIDGARFKGIDFLDDVMANGGNSFLLDSKYEEYIKEKYLKEKENLEKYIFVFVENPKIYMPIFASAIYSNPSKNMKVIGITGTKGKSTIAFTIYNILNKLGVKVGFIGTIGSYINGKKITVNARTTPESCDLQKILNEMVKKEVKYVILEVSSIGVTQHRVDEINFNCMSFTNFSEDHVSQFEHKTIEEYFEAKIDALRLSNINIINIDDENVKKAENILKNNTCIKIGMNQNADIYCIKDTIQKDKGYWKYDIVIKENKLLNTDKDEKITITTSMVGEFNIYNILVIIANLKLNGFNTVDIVEGLKNNHVLGRMEYIENNKKLNIYVDYAHTAVSIESILKLAKTLTKGRIIALWGACGDRDRIKRPQMAEVSEKYADYTFVTQDQVFYEDLDQIINDIIKGFSKEYKNYEVIKDRKEAIQKAIDFMNDEDILLIMGLGHERYLNVCGIEKYFNEREIIQEYINMKG